MEGESRAELCRELLVHYNDIHAALTIMVRCPHLGDDLTQEAFRRAFRYARLDGHIRNPGGWLRVIAKNVARDYARQSSRRTATRGSDALVQALEENGSPVDDLPNWPVDQQDLMAAIDALPATTKALVVGYYFHKKGCRALGAELGLSRGSVKVRLYRARKRLRAWLSRIEGRRHE